VKKHRRTSSNSSVSYVGSGFSRIAFSRIAFATVAIAIAASVAIWIWLRPVARPNVILITIDTLRADHLGVYGDHDAATPTLDALARRGVRFADVVSPAPLTLPSHTSILTGLTPARHGVRNNPEFVVSESVPTLAERFHAAGYATAAFVSGFPLSRRFGLARGFDVYDDRFPRGDAASLAPYTERRADGTVAAVRAWFDRERREASRGPYLLWVHFFDPHRPYDPPEPFRDRFSNPYDGEIAFVDAQIADVLTAAGDLDATHTIVAVTADHGEALDEHGEPTHGLFIYSSTIRVPLILAGPTIPPGVIVEPFVRLIDVTPTLLDLTRLAALPGIEGRSLAPLIAAGSQPADPEPAYFESLFGRLCCGWAPLYGWREGSWAYIDAPRPELYDVGHDPAQRTNVAAAHPAEVARFRQSVRAIAESSNETRSRPDTASAKALASVGYFSGSATVKASLRDPKDMAALAARMEAAIAREHVQPASAAGELKAVIDADPGNALARRHLAIALSALRDYPGAIREIEALQQLGDMSLETTVLLGECLRLAGRPADAVRTLEQALERDKGDAAVHDALGRALVAAGRRDDAVATFDRALSLQPDDAEALSALADLALERGDVAGARRRLEALRAGDPDDDGVAVKLGTVLARTGDLPGAINLLQSVVARSPSNSDGLVNLAAALAKGGDSVNAVRYFERAVAAGATAPVVINGLAVAKLETGDRAGAVVWMKRSLTARPDQPDIRELLRRVEADLAAAGRTPVR
jgi:choline-sulfatase